MKFGVVTFPGSNCNQDMVYVLKEKLNLEVVELWHKNTSIEGCDAIVLPGGFSYGDYLRSGAIARFSPLMKEVINHAQNGGIVIGVCNGFQILCESKLLPGILIKNKELSFICEWSNLKVNNDSIFTSEFKKDEIINIPISHGEGNFQADKATIDELETENRIIFRYCSNIGIIDEKSNPNGSINNIAGITNKKGNVLGMMPHPEKACEKLIGGDDGLGIFKSVIEKVLNG